MLPVLLVLNGAGAGAADAAGPGAAGATGAANAVAAADEAAADAAACDGASSLLLVVTHGMLPVALMVELRSVLCWLRWCLVLVLIWVDW